jgi:hypothetical protein
LRCSPAERRSTYTKMPATHDRLLLLNESTARLRFTSVAARE